MNFKARHLLQLHQQKFDFEQLALQLFRYQAEQNPVYREFLSHLHIKVAKVKRLEEIPFLPIEFFKTHDLVTGEAFTPEITFYSSGTTQAVRSRHHVSELAMYTRTTELIFQEFFGPLQDYVVLALLPSYLEQGGSSLVTMAAHFMQLTGQQEEGFFLQDHKKLLKTIQKVQQGPKKVLLIGVSYALLDLAEKLKGKTDFTNVLVMETGGMKGRRREMIREELHEHLKQGFGVNRICSEYGMTEMLSQAYSLGEGIFRPGFSMQVLLRDLNDPFDINPNLRSGGINIIDLANVDSCAFIETKDIGRLHTDGTFEVLGRFDNSDIRGCNLLIA